MSPIKIVTSAAEFPTGLDLNLSLQYSTSPSLEIQPVELPQSDQYDRRVADLANKPPAISGEFEDGGSQTSTLSTLTRKRTLREEEEPPPVPDEEDGENSRKKLRLSRNQSLLLEDTFKDHNTLNPRQKQALAKQLGLSARQVEVWFQNRRARTKLKQTEAECEYMKRNCESLMDRVRRLQKEVNDLRALNPAPQIYMQMPPATTLTLCPSCERVGLPLEAPGSVNPGRIVNPWAAAGQMSNRPF